MKRLTIPQAIEQIERDHGGCDQNTCTLSVALRSGFDLIAIHHWDNSGAASQDWVRPKYTQKELMAQNKEFCETTPHVDCPRCNAILWLPEECDYHCDSCGKDIPRPKEDLE